MFYTIKGRAGSISRLINEERVWPAVPAMGLRSSVSLDTQTFSSDSPDAVLIVSTFHLLVMLIGANAKH